MQENGLVFSALCADFNMDFDKEDNEAEIKRTMEMMDLAVDLGTNVITTHIHNIPDDVNAPGYKTIQRSIKLLGDYGDSIGVYFASETGPEKAFKLKRLLDSVDTKSARVNLDPANFVMLCGQDPVDAVYVLRDYIVHTHAKDGVKADNKDGYLEMPLGQGKVPFADYLAALKDIGYDGFLTIEREVGENAEADIRHAYDFLTEQLKRLY